MRPPGRNIELNGERKIIEAIENLPLSQFDRMHLVLTYLGIKPASALEITYRLGVLPEEESANLKALVIENTLKNAGLVLRVKRKSEEKGSVPFVIIDFLVAREEDDLKRLDRALMNENHEEAGKLLGYPSTAVEAFSRGMRENCLERYVICTVQTEKKWWLSLPEEERQELLEEGVMNFLTFRLSWQNWREELETVRWWQRTIQEKAPRVYEDIMRANFWGNKVRGWGDYVE